MTTSKFPGGFLENLKRAVINAHRHRGQELPDDTLDYWRELLAEAHLRMAEGKRGASQIAHRAAQLQVELDIRDHDAQASAGQ